MNSRKTICIFSALFSPHIGGVETFTKAIAETFVSQGYRVIIVTNNHASLPAKEMPQENLLIYRLPCYSLLNARLPWPKRDKEFKEILAELKAQQIDHICINTRFYPHSLVGAKLAKDKGLTAVVIDHGSDYLTLGNALVDPIIERYEHIVTKKLKTFKPRFFAVSSRGSQWLNTFSITSQGEIHNAIDVDAYLNQASKRDFRKEYSLAPNTLAVAFVGRLTPEKGIEELIEAANMLSADKTIQFFIAGDGPLRQALEEKAPDTVHFLGSLPSSEVAALLQAVDVFCLPSRSEGFSTALLEAAACSTVPVITNVGGVDELIPTEDYGIVLPDRSPKSIASALSSLHNDHERVRILATNINNLVKTSYNWQETTSALIEAFESMSPNNR